MKSNQSAMGTLPPPPGPQTAPGMESSPPNQMGAVKKTMPVPAITTPKMAKGKPVKKKAIRSIQDLKDAAAKSKANFGKDRQGGTDAGGLGEKDND